MELEAGTVVANRYRISRPLGRGGMGEVFAAENIRTGRPVAVKLLRSDSKAKSSAVARFRREARAAGVINSDHVTQVLDVEEDPDHGIVLVFELLAGESLIDRLKRTGPISFEELHPIVEQVWMGLADAHRAGIIHRDLKPSNVFLEQRPDGSTRVKILDFGISKLPKEMGGETLTEMGQSLGTFSFMPPEQINKAKTVDHRADIYACTTLIYQALSGQLPYQARNILAMVELKSKTEPRKLSEVMEGPTDPRLEAFLAMGLARDPAKRFQTSVDGLHAWRELRPANPSSRPGDPISMVHSVPASHQAQSAPMQSQPRVSAPTPSGGVHSAPVISIGTTNPAPPAAANLASTGSDMAATLARPPAPDKREIVPQTLREPPVSAAQSYEPSQAPNRVGPYGTAMFDSRTGAPLTTNAYPSSSSYPQVQVPRVYDEPSSAGPPSQEKTQIYRPQGNRSALMSAGQPGGPGMQERRRISVYIAYTVGFIFVAILGFGLVALLMSSFK